MTKNQARKKTRELIRKASSLMREKLEKALVCGALDLDSYEDDYILPRIIVCALLEDAKYRFRPLHKDFKKEIDNLNRFL